ncbi:hypothetical protein ABTZ58_38280 [Streptomyces sp. NPDC094143]|uniref:hypothetical protein n=1 Tax=Streptomyces sp. NPDC094143 TaxID=3155310 RepID=UPI00332D0C35
MTTRRTLHHIANRVHNNPHLAAPTPSRTLIRIIDNTDPDHDRPARLLERHYEHRRVQALVTNPHTPHTAVTDVLNGLPPAELAWIAEKAGGPDWFLAAAAAVPVPEDEDDGVVWVLWTTMNSASTPTPRPFCSPGSTPPPPVRSSPAPRSTAPL